MANKLTLISALLLAWAVAAARGSMEAEEKECADQLQELAACIPFVSGSASKPTPECCADTERVRSKKPQCLCVLIKESTDPSLALPVNTTLALQMPAACHSDAKVSDCPRILKLPPDSPDAKIFKEASAGPATTTNPSTTSPASSGSSGSSSGSTEGSSSKAATASEGGKVEWFGVKSMVGLVVSAWVLLM